MPLQATSGAASYDAFGGGVAAVPNYIEDVFSTWLYTGNVTPLAITNGIDLSTYGGLIWTKERNNTASHLLIDSQRGLSGGFLRSNTTDAADTSRVSESISSFNTDGYSLHAPDTLWDRGSYNYVSWTFRKQPKFFDVVTYTGNGGGQNVPHNLGSAPGMVIVKRTDSGSEWAVWHRGSGGANDLTGLSLNSTSEAVSAPFGGISGFTSTFFRAQWVVGADSLGSNVSGATYVAYLFAHNAGGFGLTGTDNVISCGSFTTDGSGNATVSLGYEPQWVLVKGTGSGFGWSLFDNMRGMPVTGDSRELLASSSSAEGGIGSSYFNPTATGFYMGAFSANQAYIYIAIRRGPMKVPTSGTSVFSAQTYSGSGSTRTLDATIVPDVYIGNTRDPSGNAVGLFVDRLRGNSKYIRSTLTDAETGTAPARDFSGQTGFTLDGVADNVSGRTYVSWFMRRAPSFFDEVCYTGTGAARTLNHNLGAVPELMIVKRRDGTSYGDWLVYHASLGNTKYLLLNTPDASATANSGAWNFTNPTSTQFTVGDWESLNTTATYVAYLFATCAGVSKVGSYTGTATTKQIDCGFTGGARFVLIKKTSGTGSWYVWDSSRGIVSGNDPYLLLNSTAAEVTNTDYIDTYSAGFEISSTAPAEINASGGSFIFLAIS